MPNSQENLKKEALKLPGTPGVYKFIDKNNKILYIGKATSLKSRVRSYLSKDISEKRSPLIGKMVEEAISIKFEKTDSVLEALLLESKLIKDYKPKYNVADKDQKSFNYVVITEEKFPRILLIRERILKSKEQANIYKSNFGPFPHGKELREALKIIRKIFPFRDKCNENQKKPCFNYQIGLCPGVCIGKINEKEYGKTIKHIKTFFEGNKKRLIKDLEKEMKSFIKLREFEKAGEIKNKIFALRHIEDVAMIKEEKKDSKHDGFRIEAYDIAHTSGTDMVGVMTVMEDGEIKKADYRMFKIKGQKGADDTKALREILERRFKHTEWRLPNMIVLDGGLAQLNVGENIIKSLSLNIQVVAVTKDNHHKAKDIRFTDNDSGIITKNRKKEILIANSESHRFAIKFHRKLRNALF